MTHRITQTEAYRGRQKHDYTKNHLFFIKVEVILQNIHEIWGEIEELWK